MLAVHRWALRELLGLASGADNDSARVGAISRRVSVARDLLVLLQATGAVPSGSEAFLRRVENEKRVFAVAVLDVPESRGVDYGEVERELAARLGRPEVLVA